MKLSLSKLEIKALQVLCRGEKTVSSLAQALGVSKSLASRIVKNLAKINFVDIKRQRTEKQIILSFSSGAELFRSLYFSRQNAQIESWLSGKTIEVLIVLSHKPATIDQILAACNCSKPTLYKVLAKLGAVGVASKENGSFKITDELVRDFAQAFATNAQYVITKNVREFDIIFRIRKNCLIRTKDELISPFFITGITRLFRLGLQGIQNDYTDYYFSLDEKPAEISLEETIVHALLMSRAHFDTEKSLITIFLKQNSKKINWLKLNEVAKKYSVSEKLREIMVALDLHEKLREYNE